MSILFGHALAARFLGQAIIDRASSSPLGADDQAMLIVLGRAHIDAADTMEAEMRAQSQAGAGSCTLDHATMKGPTCTACKAPIAKR